MARRANLAFGFRFLERQRGRWFVQFHERVFLPAQASRFSPAFRVRADQGRQRGRLADRLRRTGTVLHDGGNRGRHFRAGGRSEEHTSELQSLMRISYAVFCLKKKKTK